MASKILKMMLYCLGATSMALTGCGTNAQLAKSTVPVRVNRTTAGNHRLMVMAVADGAPVRFVSHKEANFGGAPSINDNGIVLNVAAAFTLDTSSMDVCGDHVVAGQHLAGYDDVTATGHMLVVNNKVSILPNSCLQESLRAAADGKGYLFQQCLIVEDGKGMVERIPQAIRDRKAHIIYRAACLINDGSLAIVQGDEPMYCNEFIDALVALGAQQALYLDMGTWAWGWVRDGSTTIELAERFNNTRYQSNWLQVTQR